MPAAPELTAALADEIGKVSFTLLGTSRRYKKPRLDQIKQSEDFYLGVVKAQLKNVFNIPFPFMSGFIDHYMSKIDDPPHIEFTHHHEADYKLARKATAAIKIQMSSPEPHAKWNLKDRWEKKGALFTGRGIQKHYPESDPKYRHVVETVDFKNFHFEPNGGGHLESHLFCGEDAIYKTKENLEEGAAEGYYDKDQVGKLIENATQNDYKENEESQNEEQSRQRALGLDPGSNNYVGENVFRFAQFILTHKGRRWLCLFDEQTGIWIRVKPYKEVVPSGKYWYTSWATHEDPRVFASKAPADDARPLHDVIQTVINQELYSRHKQNMGQRAYDPHMFKDIEALQDWRPDGLVPADTKGGVRAIGDGIYEFRVAGLTGTLDLVSWLDSMGGQKMGSTPGSQGQSEQGKKVGIFFGELQQVDEFIGLRNKSYREVYEERGAIFLEGAEEHMTEPEAVEVMGASGVEWDELSARELKSKHRDLSVKIVGGRAEEHQNEIKSMKRLEALKALQSVNPNWKDQQLMRESGFEDDEVKEAFEPVSADRELLSEAAQAEEDIVRGVTPKLNRGANAAFMQHILDFATDTNDLDEEIYNRLIDYAMAHAEIAAENEARSAADFIKRRQLAAVGAPTAGVGPGAPVSSSPPVSSLSSPGVASRSQRMTDQVLP